eukprot:TRINITY_DN14615_c0_g1_i1.p1 TRINITY_DN14615_c0_g1~~TRINITY_DN14615_c0_g1_i1.p1  ORF type:complete len:331 (+),score=76.79 TRINITY_DN14615_c0_g1_i1:59-1051(+)
MEDIKLINLNNRNTVDKNISRSINVIEKKSNNENEIRIINSSDVSVALFPVAGFFLLEDQNEIVKRAVHAGLNIYFEKADISCTIEKRILVSLLSQCIDSLLKGKETNISVKPSTIGLHIKSWLGQVGSLKKQKYYKGIRFKDIINLDNEVQSAINDFSITEEEQAKFLGKSLAKYIGRNMEGKQSSKKSRKRKAEFQQFIVLTNGGDRLKCVGIWGLGIDKSENTKAKIIDKNIAQIGDPFKRTDTSFSSIIKVQLIRKILPENIYPNLANEPIKVLDKRVLDEQIDYVDVVINKYYLNNNNYTDPTISIKKNLVLLNFNYNSNSSNMH